MRISDLKDARRYWVEILDKENGIAEVEGTIRDDNSIVLKTRHVKRLRLRLRRELLPLPGSFRVILNKREVFSGDLNEDCTLLACTADEAGDPFLGYSAALDLTAKP